MLYVFPHYYGQFRCIASQCPDTCCAGWEIKIDSKSLERYGSVKGPLGNRIHNSIDWKRRCFLQYKNRCVFLNEENLCDLYTELGPEGFCRTCRTYPRHIEEFEGIREISLCMSCMEAARIILGTRQPVRLLTRRTEREEEYEDFDFFLYTKLADTRDLLLEIMQGRRVDVRIRMALCLSLSHDLQRRIRSGRMFEADSLLEKYRREGREAQLARKLAGMGLDGCSRYSVMRRLYCIFERMGELNPLWPELREKYGVRLYGRGRDGYEKERLRFLKSSSASGLGLLQEQLMVYFIFAYFNGAVYDKNPYEKLKFALASSLLIAELCQARWLESGGLSHEDMVDLAHCYCREVEHSDENRRMLEQELDRNPDFGIRKLLKAIEG